ncbi:M48 family metallopeptidase [Caenispirillum bisanense]|uniref:Peptidase family M48 n=1 Tax=Caenispirillum bisanense TaxID=414052 RepID=A0A286GJ43_9PROT|nr:M48 family metallopeptidase [Caenispirillum bisanense]SOD95538.1 Peptidase family M48 [Caenispirillum bisanense]
MRRFLVVLAVLVLAACETVPITGRQQVSLISDAEIGSQAAAAFADFVDESDVVDGTAEARMVTRVGRRIQRAVEDYFTQQGQAERLAGYDWEYVLVDSEEINAFCMPGGKVAVYTGILPVAETEQGLAVVMGHEVAHAVANHGNERMSQAMLAEAAGALVVGLLAGDDDDSVGSGLLQAAFGLGAQVGVLLPFSRLHESEADRLGMIFMAMAGYDPREAPRFWQRMAAAGGGGGDGLEFLSTHPSDSTRVRELDAAMAEALAYHRGDPAEGEAEETAPASGGGWIGVPEMKTRKKGSAGTGTRS